LAVKSWPEHFPIVFTQVSRSEDALAICFDEHLYPTGDPMWSDDARGLPINAGKSRRVQWIVPRGVV
jgi:hypothetical protein